MNQKELSSFLRILSHDLQNQIGAIDLNLQIIPTMPAEGDSSYQMIEPFINRAALSASEMIETLTDLQAYAYGLGNAAKPAIAPFNLTMVVRDCALILGGRASLRKVSLILGESPDITVYGDKDAVSRGLKLLVAEALRSSFPDVSLTLSCGSEPAIGQESRSFVMIEATQDGLFEPDRPSLSMFLARHALSASGVDLEYPVPEDSGRSALRLVF